MTTIIVISLLINGIQHCLSSLWMGKILPGMVSAAFLLIPFSLVYLVFLEIEIQFGIFDLVKWFIFSILIMVLSIYVSLRLGYLIYLMR